MKIGAPLKSGKPHDGRAPDYDDWDLNGDLLFWNEPLQCSYELSSMGIRVSPESMDRQLTMAGCDDRRTLPFHKAVLSGELPYTIGGGIGQSRLCMLLLGSAHIGEVQASVWDEATRAACAKAGIPPAVSKTREKALCQNRQRAIFFCISASEKQAHIFLFAAVPAQPPDKPGVEQVHGQDGRTPQHRLPGGLLIDQQERVRPGDEPLVIGPEGHRAIEHRGDQRQRNAPRRQLWLPFQQDKGDKGHTAG